MHHQDRNKRNVSGILLLDKPMGITSNAALQKVKHLFCAKKAGHTGSLDPLATGMLPICFGQATKFSEYLLTADKSYLVKAQLGVKTTTGDAEGEDVATRPVTGLTLDKINQHCEEFRGEIQQIPSMYSALKHKGKPLYEYARQGITIERQPRTVSIHEFSLLDFDGDSCQLTCKVSCSKGTYIRTLMEDLGEALGCGAHVVHLRRLKVGDFSADQMVTLDKLCELHEQNGFVALDKYVRSVSIAAEHLSQCVIDHVTYLSLAQGRVVSRLVQEAPGVVRLLSKQGQFLGVAKILEDGCLKPVKLLDPKQI